MFKELCEPAREFLSLDDFFCEETFKTLGVETPLRHARFYVSDTLPFEGYITTVVGGSRAGFTRL